MSPLGACGRRAYWVGIVRRPCPPPRLSVIAAVECRRASALHAGFAHIGMRGRVGCRGEWGNGPATNASGGRMLGTDVMVIGFAAREGSGVPHVLQSWSPSRVHRRSWRMRPPSPGGPRLVTAAEVAYRRWWLARANVGCPAPSRTATSRRDGGLPPWPSSALLQWRGPHSACRCLAACHRSRKTGCSPTRRCSWHGRELAP